MSKVKRLTKTQLANINAQIVVLEKPIELQDLLFEVKEYFHRQPTHDCQDITPRTMAMLLNKFIRIMEGTR
jgi:hypothetical protein